MRHLEMPMGPAHNTYPERHRSYRDRLKARGMRQIVLWVPDTRRPGFADNWHAWKKARRIDKPSPSSRPPGIGQTDAPR
jgi:hypothetical protein